jgi:hypothetical protein
MGNNVSYRYQAAASIGVSHVLVICWHALPESFNNINIKTLPCYSADQGHCGQLESMKEELLAWIFERREMGLVVSTLSIIIKACCLLPLIEQKSAITCYFVTRRFLKNTRLCSAWGRRCCSIPPARCAKRRRSSRTLSVQCTKDRSMIYAGSSTWTRRQYFFQCIQKNARDSWQEDRCYQDLNKQHKACYRCAYHHRRRQPVGPHGCICHYPTPSGVTVDTVIRITHCRQLNKYTVT